MKNKNPVHLIISLVLIAAGIFLLSGGVAEHKKISAIISPHHDLVKDQRDNLLKKVSKIAKPATIILVSPNHFNTGSTDIITTDRTWKLLNAEIIPDQEKIQKLVDGQLVSNEESAFSREHGITNLLSPVNRYFPWAKIIPIIIRQNVDKDKINGLSKKLGKICKKNCLLIASVDFSHYQPGALAEIHDDLSMRALSNLDEDLVWQAEVDSEQSLYMAIKWAKLNGTKNFHLEENANSGKLANSRDVESTSYVFGWYEKGVRQKQKPETTFLLHKNLDKKNNNLGERFFAGVDQEISDKTFMDFLQNEQVNIANNQRALVSYLSELVEGKTLVLTGQVNEKNIKLVLLPLNNAASGVELLRGDIKTEYISRIRQKFGIEISNYDYDYGYDIIELDRN